MYKYFASVVLAAMLSLSAVVTQAQTAPDNKDIFEQTLNSESPYYYPTLMMRYLAEDTTLSEKDYYYLYYGYAYSDQYSPLAPIPSEDQTWGVPSPVADTEVTSTCFATMNTE